MGTPEDRRSQVLGVLATKLKEGVLSIVTQEELDYLLDQKFITVELLDGISEADLPTPPFSGAVRRHIVKEFGADSARTSSAPTVSEEQVALEYQESGGYCFTEGGAINPPYQCVIDTISDDALAVAIGSGLYCLLLGHRQAGKSSTVVAAKKRLKERNSRLEVFHITLVGKLQTVSETWGQILSRLHSLDVVRFPLPEPAYEASAEEMRETFLSWFIPQTGRTQAAVVIDEAASMADVSGLADVLSAFRACRDHRMNGWLLHSCVLVGTEAVAGMVVEANRSGARNFSPFTVDKSLEPAPFSEMELEELLNQFCERKKLQLLPSTSSFAEDVWQRTRGHRGLSVVCCVELEQLMWRTTVYDLESWRFHATRTLVQVAANRHTYGRLLLDLVDLPPTARELLEEVLLNGACWVRRSHPMVQMLLDGGFAGTVPIVGGGGQLRKDAVNGTGGTADAADSLITVAAPLLAATMLSRGSFEVDPSLLLARPEDYRELGLWVLTSALQFVDERILEAPEVQLVDKNKEGQVSEYTWQAQFGLIARGILLSQADLRPRWLMLPEVVAEGNKERLDWLLRNGVGPYGYEFVIWATQKSWNEHWERSLRFAEEHQAHVFAVNVVLPTRKTGIFPVLPQLPDPTSEVTALNVKYHKQQRELEIFTGNGDKAWRTLPLHGPKVGQRIRFPRAHYCSYTIMFGRQPRNVIASHSVSLRLV